MSKKIEDYAHLYIGHKVRHPGLANDRILTLKWLGSLQEKQIDFKLLLRPLSDMKEEEKTELCIITKLISNDELPKSEQHAAIMHDLSKNMLMDAIKDKDIDCRWSFEGWCILFPWFLKKGFDLFGLIEANLAIDSTTTQ